MIKNISREEMDGLLPSRFNIDGFIGAEAEWFSDKVGNIIGTIAEGTANMNWGYAVLRRDDTGLYHFWDLETRIDSCNTARVQIVQVMEATQKDGRDSSRLVG